ncbi:hypothetical protein SK128_028221 [Halocaridina rubra]|uniref:Pentraxin (PTX) domain-containing protein n=1 Tax=Halocaridina rubra TaxID=373956 RepID=A0AAN8XW25_HALRR
MESRNLQIRMHSLTVLFLIIADILAQVQQRGGSEPSSARVLVLQESGEPSSRSYARLLTPFPELVSFTLCYRIQMYRFREESTLISYALDNTKDDELRFDHHLAAFQVAIHNKWAVSSLATPIRYWAHFCLTMDKVTGTWVVFLDGKAFDTGQYPTPVESVTAGGVFIVGESLLKF